MLPNKSHNVSITRSTDLPVKKKPRTMIKRRRDMVFERCRENRWRSLTQIEKKCQKCYDPSLLVLLFLSTSSFSVALLCYCCSYVNPSSICFFLGFRVLIWRWGRRRVLWFLLLLLLLRHIRPRRVGPLPFPHYPRWLTPWLPPKKERKKERRESD